MTFLLLLGGGWELVDELYMNFSFWVLSLHHVFILIWTVTYFKVNVKKILGIFKV